MIQVYILLRCPRRQLFFRSPLCHAAPAETAEPHPSRKRARSAAQIRRLRQQSLEQTHALFTSHVDLHPRAGKGRKRLFHPQRTFGLFSKADFADLHRRRWLAELFVRDVKISPGMDALKCKSPAAAPSPKPTANAPPSSASTRTARSPHRLDHVYGRNHIYDLERAHGLERPFVRSRRNMALRVGLALSVMLATAAAWIAARKQENLRCLLRAA